MPELTALQHWVPDIAERDVYVCGPSRGPTASSGCAQAAGFPTTGSTSRALAGDPMRRSSCGSHHGHRRGAAVRLPHLDQQDLDSAAQYRAARPVRPTSTGTELQLIGQLGRPGRRSGSANITTYTGSVAQTRWGPVQVKITVQDGKITKVTSSSTRAATEGTRRSTTRRCRS